MPVGNIRQVVLVGCGGTGSILAEHLCRMIAGFHLDVELTLYDGDVVEEANIKRQNFAPHEIGANKAQALALRLVGQFAMPVAANAEHVTRKTLEQYRLDSLIISCTDTLQSRRLIAEIPRRYPDFRIWLDTCNDLHHGQVIVGNTHLPGFLKDMYNRFYKDPTVRHLPDIAALNPAILKARKSPVKAGCAAMPFATQGFGVNAASALAAATIARQILVDGQIRTAAIYFDVSVGRMLPRLIDRSLFKPWAKRQG